MGWHHIHCLVLDSCQKFLTDKKWYQPFSFVLLLSWWLSWHICWCTFLDNSSIFESNTNHIFCLWGGIINLILCILLIRKRYAELYWRENTALCFCHLYWEHKSKTKLKRIGKRPCEVFNYVAADVNMNITCNYVSQNLIKCQWFAIPVIKSVSTKTNVCTECEIC